MSLTRSTPVTSGYASRSVKIPAQPAVLVGAPAQDAPEGPSSDTAAIPATLAGRSAANWRLLLQGTPDHR